jgi:hypothetical protein
MSDEIFAAHTPPSRTNGRRVVMDSRVNRLLEWLEKQRQDYADMVTDAGETSLWCKDEADKIRDHTANYYINDPDDIDSVRATAAQIRAMTPADAKAALNALKGGAA